jgi:hypothetical protein
VVWLFIKPGFPPASGLPNFIMQTINPVFYGIYLISFTFYEIIRDVRRG